MLLADLRYSCRIFVRNPGFALIAILSVALGVGLNATMFSYVDALLLRPLPASDPGRIVGVVSTSPGTRVGAVSYPDYVDLRDRTQTLSALTCYELTHVGVSPSRKALPQMTFGVIASGNFFSGLGIQIALGRGFRPEEDATPGRDLVTVISHSLWERMFASDPNVIGRTMRLNGAEFTIIGVAPATFTGPESYVLPDVYIPMNSYPQAISNSTSAFLTARGTRDFTLLGRLKPGVSERQAQAELATVALGLAARYPETNRDRGIAVMSYRRFRFANDPIDSTMALMLLAITGLVLLIACANVANLVLGRGAARAKELAIRMAVGGSRARLVRQLLTESLLLALLGGVVGLALAYGGVQLLLAIPVPSDFPISFGVRMDFRLLAFSFAATIATGLIFGLLPAIRVTRADLSSAIKSGDQGPAQHAWWRGRLAGRNLLVIAQLTFSVVLLILSAFFMRGFAAARDLNPGFRIDHTLFFSVDASLVRYDETKAREFFRNLENRLREQPGVRDVALSWTIPFNAGQMMTRRLIVDGYEHKTGEDYPEAWSNTVDEHFFPLMEMPILKGRGFDSRDMPGSPRVVIVNETLAARMWPNRDPIGQRLRLDRPDGPEAQVIGIAKAAKYAYWAESPQMAFWLPFSQNYESHVMFEVRAAGDPAAMAAVARSQVRALDPDMPVIRTSTMEAYYRDRFLLGPRLLAQCVAAIGLIGLLLAVVGLYGVVAYAVSRRTREFGIRMAIGARPGDMLRMVLGQGLVFTVFGVVIGGAIAIVAGGYAQSFVIGASPRDPLTLAAVVAILTAVMMMACWVPARRASRVDPVRALKQD